MNTENIEATNTESSTEVKAKRKYTKSEVRVNSDITQEQAQALLIPSRDLLLKTQSAMNRVIVAIASIEEGDDVSVEARNTLTNLISVLNDTEFTKVVAKAHKTMNARLVTMIKG